MTYHFPRIADLDRILANFRRGELQKPAALTAMRTWLTSGDDVSRKTLSAARVAMTRAEGRVATWQRRRQRAIAAISEVENYYWGD